MSEVYDFVATVKDQLAPNTFGRYDCPECGSRNSLSITRRETRILYHCFDASCNAKGQVKGINDPNDVDAIIKGSIGGDVQQSNWTVPDYFVKVDEQYYDPKKDRIIWYVKNNKGVIVGAHGRKLLWSKKDSVPKWWKYGDTSYPYVTHCHRDNYTGVIVEDCKSADKVSASGMADGIALGGTELPSSSIKHLKHYTKIWVALDRDASQKSFNIATQIKSYGVPDVKIKILYEDIKYLSNEVIVEMFS